MLKSFEQHYFVLTEGSLEDRVNYIVKSFGKSWNKMWGKKWDNQSSMVRNPQGAESPADLGHTHH